MFENCAKINVPLGKLHYGTTYVCRYKKLSCWNAHFTSIRNLLQEVLVILCYGIFRDESL